MLDHLFAQNPAAPMAVDPLRPLKGVIIGTGQVGMACAYAMVIQNTFDEMVLVDINRDKLEGEVMDLQQGMPFVQPTAVTAGTLADGVGADIVIITAGAAQKPGETRLDLVQRNVEIFKTLIPEVVSHCPEAILLMVTNPVDILTYVTWKLSGLPHSRVLGSGTVLDTGRFRYLLAQKLSVDPRSLHAYIIGEHGDSEVPFWSEANVAGARLYTDATPEPERQMLDDLFLQVKNAAYEIIRRKGYTSYAIGLAVTQIVQAILRDQNRVLTVSSLMPTPQNLGEVCLSLPSVVGRTGVSRVLNASLNTLERSQLETSAATLRSVIDQIRF
jgi:L-lactate dehydrogenase